MIVYEWYTVHHIVRYLYLFDIHTCLITRIRPLRCAGPAVVLSIFYMISRATIPGKGPTKNRISRRRHIAQIRSVYFVQHHNDFSLDYLTTALYDVITTNKSAGDPARKEGKHEILSHNIYGLLRNNRKTDYKNKNDCRRKKILPDVEPGWRYKGSHRNIGRRIQQTTQ